MGDDAPNRSVNSGRLQSRRGVLRALAVTGIATLAGCGGTGSDTDTLGTSSTDRETSTNSTTTGTSPTTGVVTNAATQTTESPTVSGTPSTTLTPGELSVPPDTAGSLRDRVSEVGAAVRPAVVFLKSRLLGSDGTGAFLAPSLVVTAASTLESRDVVVDQPSIGTIDGRMHDATLLDRAGPSDDRESDLAALRVDTGGPTLPEGRADDLSAGDVVVQVGHDSVVGRWTIQFGRVRRWTDDGRFVTSLPFPSPGGPVVTLEGRVVAITTRAARPSPPSTETPPPVEPSTVYVDRKQWKGIRNVPISEVRAFADEATG